MCSNAEEGVFDWYRRCEGTADNQGSEEAYGDLLVLLLYELPENPSIPHIFFLFSPSSLQLALSQRTPMR